MRLIVMQDPEGNLAREAVVFLEDGDRTPAEEYCPPDMKVVLDCTVTCMESHADEDLESAVSIGSIYRKTTV